MLVVCAIGFGPAAGVSPAGAAVGDWRGVLIAPPGANSTSQVDDGWVAWVNRGDSQVIRVFDCAMGVARSVGEVEDFFANCALDDGRVAWVSRVDGRIQLYLRPDHRYHHPGDVRVSGSGGYFLDGSLLAWSAGGGRHQRCICAISSREDTRLTSNGYWDGQVMVGDGLVVWLATPDGDGGDEEVFIRHAGAAAGER